ncbi:hypothetical protein N0V93_005987 [Gnomoniopsis smithogilvyi]|uniref:Sucrose transporter n=1 Tax=Gnomoniopsis smithogilvyi TaxID=1191159 RepID=A0A9W8YNI6_9PEZI|nr:hypothetical protein N0V93_005987 [Gnomoniopsis smithogilvyi]
MDVVEDSDSSKSLAGSWSMDGERVELLEASRHNSRGIGFLLCLAAGIGGVQFIFVILFANGTTYLSSLGLTRTAIALVWTSGPISGMIVQPYLGLCSDRSCSSWGRRRPFIAAGGLACVICLIGLALFPIASVAVTLIVALNVAVQPLQVGLRALIAESGPRQQQPLTNGLAGVIVSAANVVGYTLNIADLRLIGVGSQFSGLCLLTTVGLALPVLLTCLVAREPAGPISEYSALQKNGTRTETAKQIIQLCYLSVSFPQLSSQVYQVYKTQFLSWMGWFPFLFYVSPYIAENYRRSSSISDQPRKDLDAAAARAGTFGLLFFSLLAFLTGAGLAMAHAHPTAKRQPDSTRRTIFGKLLIQRNIRNIWMLSQVLFALCVVGITLASSLVVIYICVALSGISWAVTIWAPYTILSAYVSYNDEYRHIQRAQQPLMAVGYCNANVNEVDRDTNGDECDYALHPDSVLEVDHEGDFELEAGIIFGLHNCAIAGPQIIAAAGSSLVFWLVDGSLHDGIAWVMRAGGLSALGAIMFITT